LGGAGRPFGAAFFFAGNDFVAVFLGAAFTGGFAASFFFGFGAFIAFFVAGRFLALARATRTP
jgi:hypothetical protein